MVTYGGEQSLDRFLALSARGIPFNIAHAAGNVALALVAGPAIVRMLIRYRRRFEFAWGDRRTHGPPSAAPPRRASRIRRRCVLLVALLRRGPAPARRALRRARGRRARPGRLALSARRTRTAASGSPRGRRRAR